MTTTLGADIRGQRARVALGIALAAVGLDCWLVWLNYYPFSIEGRWAVALVSCALLCRLANGRVASLGLTTPIGGWRKWFRITGYLAAIVTVIAAVAFAAWRASGRPLPGHLIRTQDLGWAFIHMCVLAPLLEEPTYRLALCVGFAAACGPRWAIFASGVAFAVVHVIAGVPSPENLLGGFVLGWAFVASGSIYVPWLLHVGGNGLVLLAHLIANLLLVER